MAGRIPQDFIDELLNRVDIVDVIDERVTLKKAGKEYTACCPFHNEKTPSFTVSPDKQFYHCFGCGAHGTALGFLMEYAHMDFPEAVENLAARAGMQVPRSGPSGSSQNQLTPLYEILGKAGQYYRAQLGQHAAASRARSYLKQRGLSGDIVERFSIGFAPPGWDNLIKTLGTDDVSVKQLITTGMVIDKDDKRYDRFRDRIMFPIRDRRGRVIGFGGRVLGDDTPKYLNSPETPVFHKGRELYGLYEARQVLRSIPRLLVVEGYMDVVALAQFDIPYAVATLGTATTTDHLETLFRTTAEIVFCFDGDRAGRQAAWRALENALPVMREGRQIGFMFLPEGEDPDSLVRREGREAFERLVQTALPLSEYLMNNLAADLDVNSVDGRARLADKARPLLGKLHEGLYKEMLVQQLANRVHMEPQQLTRHLDLTATHRPAETKRRPQAPRQRQAPSPVRRAIELILHQPSLASSLELPKDIEKLDRPGISLLIKLLELTQENPHLNTAALVERFRDDEDGKHLAKLAHWQPPFDEDGMQRELQDVVTSLDREVKDLRCRQLEAKGELSDSEKDELKQLHKALSAIQPH